MEQPTRTYSNTRHGAGADGTFNAESWLYAFSKASATRNGGALRALRVDIIEDTVRCCEQLSYRLLTGEQIPITTAQALQEQVKACELHTLRELSAKQRRFPETHYEVVEGDCLEAAIDLKLNRGLNPAVLNMASHRRPGGGYKHGAGAQEENLFRRSNYYQSLEDPKKIDAGRRWGYPLRDFSGVYSPSVRVFRAAESKGYEFLPEPVALDFIAVAAYSHPQLVTAKINGKPTLRLAPEVVVKTKDKIRVILNIAAEHGHDSLVLSAFGCGAFCNPPDHMAELFRDVLEEYRGCFKHICFAIFNDHNARKEHNPLGNVLPFKRVFGVSTPADEEAAVRVAATRPGGGDDDDEAEEAQEGRLPQRRGGPRDAAGRGRGGGQSERGGPRGGAGRGGRNARVSPGGRGKS